MEEDIPYVCLAKEAFDMCVFNVEGRTPYVNNSKLIDASGNPDVLKRKPSQNSWLIGYHN